MATQPTGTPILLEGGGGRGVVVVLWANLDDGAGGRSEAGEHVEWIEGIVKA